MVVEIATGVAEYSPPPEESAATTDEVDELIRIAMAKSSL
jgi:hypothetical protein